MTELNLSMQRHTGQRARPGLTTLGSRLSALSSTLAELCNSHLPPWAAVHQQPRSWIAAGVFEATAHDLCVLLWSRDERTGVNGHNHRRNIEQRRR